MIRFYSPSPDPSPGPPTPPPSYLIAFFNVSYQSLNSWVLLSNVFLHQQSHFHLTHLSVPHARSVWDSHLPFAPSTHRLHRFHLQNASPLFSPTRPVAASSRPLSASSGPLQWPPSDIPASSCVTPHLWLFLTKQPGRSSGSPTPIPSCSSDPSGGFHVTYTGSRVPQWSPRAASCGPCSPSLGSLSQWSLCRFSTTLSSPVHPPRAEHIV